MVTSGDERSCGSRVKGGYELAERDRSSGHAGFERELAISTEERDLTSLHNGIML